MSPLETAFRIEPCMLDDYPASLSDVMGEVLQAGAVLGARLHPETARSLAELVRVMTP